MTEQQLADEEPRSLLHLTAEQVTQFGSETAVEWLLQRNAHRRAVLLVACRSLRGAAAEQRAAYQRLAALTTRSPTP
ncbi:hypothetical protein ACWERY_02315 [Streptomyces sp. NPDC004082]